MKITMFKNYRLENDQDKWLNRWFICIPLNGPAEAIECNGTGRITYDGITTRISVPFSGTEHTVATIKGDMDTIRINSFPGGVQRCYARINNKKLLVSNVVTSLFNKNEKIRLDGQVLLRQISNIPTPIDDLFLDATLLDPSSVFRIYGQKLIFEESNIKPVKSDVNSIQEQILGEFDKICRPGQPLSVLLSAGIDSRLNLALSCYFSKIYKNEIIAYHEYKDKKEHDIASRIANISRVPFVSVSRDRFKNEPLEALVSPKFIEFHGGLYRESLLRWIPYLNWIRDISPDCTIMGMGSEAHKGKFYRNIKNLLDDTKYILGHELKINAKGERDFLPYVSNQTMDSFFSALSKRALIFDDLSSQIDFVHYHAYAAKHSMARSPYLNIYYGLPFPFLGDNFLSQVFSLPKKDKADAKLSIGLISKLAPQFSGIPFISGSRKAFRSHTFNVFKDRVKYIMPKHINASRRNESIFWNSQVVRDRLIGASSEITDILERFIKRALNKEEKGRIKVKCALRMYLFLRQIEDSHGIEFICK